MPAWNDTKQKLFDSGNALGVQVAKKMNVMQEYYKQLTSVVLLCGRKVAEVVAASVVPADWVNEFKAGKNGRPPTLDEMLSCLTQNSLLPLDELSAFRKLQYNGNVGAHKPDLTEAQHSLKPVVAKAVLQVRACVRALLCYVIYCVFGCAHILARTVRAACRMLLLLLAVGRRPSRVAGFDGVELARLIDWADVRCLRGVPVRECEGEGQIAGPCTACFRVVLATIVLAVVAVIVVRVPVLEYRSRSDGRRSAKVVEEEGEAEERVVVVAEVVVVGGGGGAQEE